MAEKFIIKNDDQYKRTLYWIKRFEEDISGLRHQPLNGIHPRLRQVEIEGMESKVGDLKEEAAEWEKKRKIERKNALNELSDLGQEMMGDDY